MNVTKVETVIVVNLTSCTVEFDQTRGGFISVSAEEQTEQPIPPSGKIARWVCTDTVHAEFADSALEMGEVIGLPDPANNTFYIVTPDVKSREADRSDVIAVIPRCSN